MHPDKKYHRLPCIQRKCTECRVESIKLSENERNFCGKCSWCTQLQIVATDKSLEEIVASMRYKYITENTGTSKERKWLALVTEKSYPAHLFQYLLEKLKPYTEHQFMAKWQREQFTLLLEKLPEDTVILLRDFSEDYQCFSQDKTKTEHFGSAYI